MEENIEIWKDIKGYEGIYQVSNLGRAKKLARTIICKDGKTKYLNEKLIKLYKSGNSSYLSVYKGHKRVFTTNILNLIEQLFEDKSLIIPSFDGEIWKDIDEFHGLYQVSNLGRIKSLPKIDFIGRKRRELILKQRKDHNGYYYITLRHSTSKIYKTISVHRLVGISFVENVHNLPNIHHIDYNSSNNKYDNLSWVTQKQNMEFSQKEGRLKKYNLKKIKQRPYKKEILPDYYTDEDFKPLDEFWIEVNDFNNYRISNYGRIKEITCNNQQKLIKPFFCGGKKLRNGRPLQVCLYNENEKKFFVLNNLVATRFIPNLNKLPCSNHKDGNKTNNHVVNLEWLSYSDNQHHAINMGLKQDIGENNMHSKLTEKEVIEIRKLYKNGIGYKKLAKIFEVEPCTISLVVKRKSWKHI